MFQDWRFAVGWVTALSVSGILMLGLWLHPALRPFPPPVLLPVADRVTPTGVPQSQSEVAGQEWLDQPTEITLAAPGFPSRLTRADLTGSEVVSDLRSDQVAPTPLVSAGALLTPISDLPSDSATPTPPSSLAEAPGRAGNGVPILMYHYVRVNPVPSDRLGFNLSVTPADFALQMRFLAEAGFHTVTIAQVREYLLHGTPLPPKPIAITFDDGYDDAYTAARPVLERYHQTATFYIVTGFLNRPHYLTWSQVEDLDREGMEIASHTVHHPSLPALRGSALTSELVTSRADLESHLGHPVLDFAYPGGELNPTVVSAVAHAGYLSAVTTRSGIARRGAPLLELPRLRVWGGETLHQFASVLGQPTPLWAVR